MSSMQVKQEEKCVLALPSASIRGLHKQSSRVMFGTLTLSTLPEPDAFSLLDAVLGAGVNAFECARIYGDGKSEECVGKWLKKRCTEGVLSREDVTIVTKGGCGPRDVMFEPRIDAKSVASDLTASISALGTYIDVYMLHRDDNVTSACNVVDMMTDEVKAGKIRVWGVSNWSFARFQELKRSADERNLPAPVITSPYFSLATLETPMYQNTTTLVTTTREGREELAWYEANDVTVCAWSALGKGFFMSRDPEREFAVDRENDSEATRRLNACYRKLVTKTNIARKQRLDELVAKRGKGAHRAALLVDYVLRKGACLCAIIGTTREAHFTIALPTTPTTHLSSEEVTWLETGL